MLSEQQANRAIELYADTVRRICMVHLKNQADSEDIFQTVFLKYLLRDQPFENERHEKAWMIRVTINACKDLLRSFFRSRTVPLEQLVEVPQPLSRTSVICWRRFWRCLPSTRTWYTCTTTNNIRRLRLHRFFTKT